MLGERIRELRKENGYTQADLGKRLGVIKQTISSWENNVSSPSNETLSDIATFFGVSIDYLLGNQPPRTDDKGLYFFSFFDCWDDCVKRIRSLLKEAQLLEEDFCKELDINLKGEIVISDLVKISKRLNVSIDYLLGNSEYRHISDEEFRFAQSLSAREKNIINTFRQLNPDNQDIMVGELKKSLKEQRYESVAADSSEKMVK